MSTDMTRDVILSRCSLILAPNGSQLFLISNCRTKMRVMLRIWFACVLPMYIERGIAWLKEDAISFQLLLLASLVAGMFVSNGILIFRQVKLESLWGCPTSFCGHVVRVCDITPQMLTQKIPSPNSQQFIDIRKIDAYSRRSTVTIPGNLSTRGHKYMHWVGDLVSQFFGSWSEVRTNRYNEQDVQCHNSPAVCLNWG